MAVYPLGGPATFVAAIPHLMGLHPRRCLVLAGLDSGSRVTGLLHVELDELAQSADVLAHVVAVLGRYQPARVLLAIIDDRAFASHDRVEHDRLVADLTMGFATLEIPVAAVVRAASTMPGSPCRNSTGQDTVPDLDTSALAASRVAAGRVIYPNRATIAAELAPTDPAAVARRKHPLRHGQPPANPSELIHKALSHAGKGTLPHTDTEIVPLARAMASPRGFVTALWRTLTNPRSTRELWVCLTRAVPAPWQADAAALTAVSTYLAGDGVIATVALELAEQAAPDDALTDLLRHALSLGLSPTELADTLRRLTHDLVDRADQEN